MTIHINYTVCIIPICQVIPPKKKQPKTKHNDAYTHTGIGLSGEVTCITDRFPACYGAHSIR